MIALQLRWVHVGLERQTHLTTEVGPGGSEISIASSVCVSLVFFRLFSLPFRWVWTHLKS